MTQSLGDNGVNDRLFVPFEGQAYILTALGEFILAPATPPSTRSTEAITVDDMDVSDGPDDEETEIDLTRNGVMRVNVNHMISSIDNCRVLLILFHFCLNPIYIYMFLR